MAQVYSPTPHRVALCALARYLVHSHARDERAAERLGVSPEQASRLDRPSRRAVDPSTGDRLGPCVLGPADARRLAAVLMREASRSDGFREPDLRAFRQSLRRHPILVRETHRHPDDDDDEDEDDEDPMAAYTDAYPYSRETFADLLDDAIASLRGVDSIAALIQEVAPRSRHEAEMRGAHDDDDDPSHPGGSYDPFPPGPGAAEESSSLGLFLRRCVADFEAQSFEGSVRVFGVFAAYVLEGAGEYDDVDAAAARDRMDVVDKRLRVDARQAAAEAAVGEGGVEVHVDLRGDDEDDATLRRLGALHGSHLAPLTLDPRPGNATGPSQGGGVSRVPSGSEQHSSVRALDLSAASMTQIRDGLRDVAVRPDAKLREWIARRCRGVDQRDGYESTRDVTSALDDIERVAPKVPGAELARHLAHVSRRDFTQAMEHARRHFDYLPGTLGTTYGDGSYADGSYSNDGRAAGGRVALDVGAGTSFGLPMNPRQAFERGREIFGTGAFAGESSLQMNQSGVQAGEATAQEHADAAAAAQRARLQSALLTLGVAHFRFHHSGEALKALNEAVRTAQQNGDEASLAHALAAFCALCASSSGSLASTEGAPAVEEWREGPGGAFEGDKERRGVSVLTQPPAVQAAADARLLLRRLAKQARTLRIPHLMAYGELARARHGASRPPCGPAPWSRGLETEGGSKKESGKTRDSDLSTADSALLFRRVASSPPAAAAAASQLVEALRHAVTLGAAAPQATTQAAAAAASRSGADGQRANPNELYPPPKGLALSAGYPSGSESAMEQLSGSGSVLCGAVWDAHGVPSMARMHALRHLRCDASRRFVRRDDETDADNDPGVVPGEFPESFGGSTRSSHEAEADAASAAASDTAAALAQLARHASTHHGPDAAADVFAIAAARFPKRRMEEVAADPALAAAAAATDHDAARARGDGDACDAAARRIASLAPASTRTDPEARVEAFRARADACLISGKLGDAVFHASEAFQGSIREGLTHATLRATLTLAEAHLAAGAPAASLQHALALEHSAAALRLDGLRAAAIVVLAECWLAMSASAAGVGSTCHTTVGQRRRRDGYASMAKDALDAHAPALLSRGGLALRARARMASARAALACRPPNASDDFDSSRMSSRTSYPDDSTGDGGWDEVLVPLEDAVACCAALGAHAKEAEAHELMARTFAAMGPNHVADRNAAARRWRECERRRRKAEVAGVGGVGASEVGVGDGSARFGGIGSFPASRAVAV